MKVKKFIAVGLLAGVSNLSHAISVAGHSSSHSSSHSVSHATSHVTPHVIPHMVGGSSSHSTNTNLDANSNNVVNGTVTDNSKDVAFLAEQMAKNVSQANGYVKSSEEAIPNAVSPSLDIKELDSLMYGSIAMIIVGFTGLGFAFSQLSKPSTNKSDSSQDRINELRSQYYTSSSKPKLKI